jgi:hypothetical protein
MVLLTSDSGGLGVYGFNLPWSVWIGGLTGLVVVGSIVNKIEKETFYHGQFNTGIALTAIIGGALVNYVLWNAVEG